MKTRRRVPLEHALAWLMTALVAGAIGCSSSQTSLRDAAGDAGGDDVPGIACGPMTCAAGQVCVRTQTQGGACFLPVDGGCPAGYSSSSTCCELDPTYSCATRPAGCGPAVTCACAGATLCSANHMCSTPASDEIDCTLQAP
jgi:hypothetical protein